MCTFLKIEKINVNLLLHCKDSYFSDLTVWNICHTGTEKSWHIQNKHYMAMMQMEDWRSMLYLKKSLNQASMSISWFFNEYVYFLCTSNVGHIYPWSFPFSLLLIPRWRLENSLWFYSEWRSLQTLPFCFYLSKPC